MATGKDLAQVETLLKDGKPQEAAELLQKLQAAEAESTGAAPRKPAESPPKRDPEVIIHDFMMTVAGLHGSHVQLEALAEEYATVLKPQAKH